MTQVAKLFIRGSLMKRIAKELTPIQNIAVTNLINKVWEDPEIQNGKYEFAMILQRTIRNEYKQDLEVCLQEAWVTFWRAAVDVLYGKHKTDSQYWSTQRVVSCPSDLCDCSPKHPLCRKKVFQTWLYNYLRQILRENLRPTHKLKTVLEGQVDFVVFNMVKITIENLDPNLNFTSKIEDNTYQITIDRPIIPTKLTSRLDKLHSKYSKLGVKISVDENVITIKAEHKFKLKTTVVRERRVQHVSISCSTDDGESTQIDPNQMIHNHGGQMYNDIVSTDLLQAISHRLTPQARKVFELITNPPADFVPNHKGPIHKCDIANYLKLSKQELAEAYNTIKDQCIAVGHIPESMRT